MECNQLILSEACWLGNWDACNLVEHEFNCEQICVNEVFTRGKLMACCDCRSSRDLFKLIF